MPLYSFEKNKRKAFFLFIHVPKTGGTSIVEFLRHLKFSEYFGYDSNFRKQFKEPPQHFTYNLLNEMINIELLDFSFAIVRNPINRIISSYFWSLENSSKSSLYLNMDFQTWFNFQTEDFKKNKNTLSNHILPQYYFIGPKIKKIYYFESGLDNIFLDVVKNIGLKIKGDFKLPHIFNTGIKYNDAKKEIKQNKIIVNRIYDFYRKDYEMFKFHQKD